MKKGISHTLVIMVLVIVVFLILTFAYYAKGTGLFSRLADFVLSQEHRFLPIEPRKELKQDEKLPKNVIDVQQNFVNSIKSSLIQPTEDKICRLEFASLSGMEDFAMELSNFGNNINSKIIKVKSAEGYLYLNKLTIENAKVCLINPEILYACYIDSRRNCPKNIEGFYKNVDIIRIQNGKINDGKNTLAKYIIRIDSNKFCFVPLHSGFLTKPGCDANTASLDDDCLKDIEREIPICGKKIETGVITNKDKTAIEEFDNFVAFLKDINSKQNAQLCRRNFFFNIKNIGTGYYIYINPNGQIDLRLNKESQIIKKENIGYVPYAGLTNEDLTKTYFNNYNFIKNTFIISPAGDYSTADQSVAVVQKESLIAVSYDNKWILTEPTVYISNQPLCS